MKTLIKRLRKANVSKSLINWIKDQNTNNIETLIKRLAKKDLTTAMNLAAFLVPERQRSKFTFDLLNYLIANIKFKNKVAKILAETVASWVKRCKAKELFHLLYSYSYMIHFRTTEGIARDYLILIAASYMFYPADALFRLVKNAEPYLKANTLKKKIINLALKYNKRSK
jgi:uncharacterized membrane protein